MNIYYKILGISAFLMWGMCLTGQSGEPVPVVIAHHADYRPYCHIGADGVSSGLLIDWWYLWAEKIDTPITFIAGSSRQCVTWVNEGKADLIAGVLANKSQQDTLKFGEIIVRVKTSLFLRNDLRPKSAHQLADTIAILQSGVTRRYLEARFPDLTIKPYPTATAIQQELLNGQLTGVIYDRPSPFTENDEPQKFIKGYYNYLDIRDDALRPAMKAGNDNLNMILQRGASAITGQEMKAIASQYNIVDGRGKAEYYLIAGAIVLGLLFVILLVYTMNRRSLPRGGTAQPKSWLQVISNGESDHVEFKSSLRWDYQEGKPNKALEFVIVKSISAFMNTEGGTLLIGVDDNGNILGLENDFAAIFKGNADGFLLVITNLINKHFGKNAHRLVRAHIHRIQDRDVCAITIGKSPDPVFLKKGEVEEFYIRASAASVPLGMQESAKYIRKHFK